MAAAVGVAAVAGVDVVADTAEGAKVVEAEAAGAAQPGHPAPEEIKRPRRLSFRGIP